jgi:hypothetical protein
MLSLLLPVALAQDPDPPPAGPAAEPAPAEPAPTEPAPTEPAPAEPAPAEPAPAPPSPPGLTAEQLNAAQEAAEPPIDTREAVALEDLDKKGLKRFAPKHWKLPQNPRGQTDYTAYSLEWGEVQLGVTDITVGVLPGVQVGTVPLLDAVGVWNAQGKVNALRLGPWDLAGNVNWYMASGGYFQEQLQLSAMFLSYGASTSLILVGPWSIHAGGWYSTFDGSGKASLGFLGGLIGGIPGTPIDEETLTAAGNEVNLGTNLHAQTITARLATDVRLNRRDSVIIQAQTLLWAKAESRVLVGGNEADLFPKTDTGWLDPTTSSIITASWQLAWKHLELRLGAGLPIQNFAWIVQATELSYRFGGKTRRAERKLNDAYKASLKNTENR